MAIINQIINKTRTGITVSNSINYVFTSDYDFIKLKSLWKNKFVNFRCDPSVILPLFNYLV